MEDFTARIGIPSFTQMVIECWNELFLLIMIVMLLISRRHNEIGKAYNVKIPLTNEILVFYFAIFLYSLFDIICTASYGDTSDKGFRIYAASEFCYYTTGVFQTLFFLQIVKQHIAVRNGMQWLKNITLAMQCLHIPCIVLLLSTPFTNALYWFDQLNHYHRGDFYPIWNYATMLSFAYIISLIVLFRKKTEPFFLKIAIVSSVVPMLAFFCNFVYRGISFNTISVSITALIIFVMYEKLSSDMLIRSVKEAETFRRELAEKKVELEQSRNKILMAQIQPHFINNSLMALRSRCSDYPEIYESLTNFSRYLRSNFEILGNETLILFEQEMCNIEAYLALEQENFGDRLTVEYDIDCDDFSIPALSVQPLVENAVRHGVATYEKGGTVYINAHRSEEKIIIEVIDEGFGRSSITQQQEKRKGIGIENVRARLHAMSNGELEIIKGENRTTARIIISDWQNMGGTK